MDLDRIGETEGGSASRIKASRNARDYRLPESQILHPRRNDGWGERVKIYHGPVA